MSDLQSLLRSYCLLRQNNRQLDTEGRYAEGVAVLAREIMEYGIDPYSSEQVKNAMLKRGK